MSEWQKVPLGGLLTRITYGFTNPMPTTESGPSMVTAKDIRNGQIDYSTARFTSQEAFDNLTDKSRPRIGDVLLTKDGSIGRVAVCDRPNVCINQSVALLQPNGRVLSKYLAYLLQAPEYQEKMAADADGSTIKHIYITRVDKMAVMLPSLSVQRAIAAVLGALDDKIAANTKLATTADELARIKFDAMLSEARVEIPLSRSARFVNGKNFTRDATGVGRVVIRIAELNSGISGSTVRNDVEAGEDNIAHPGDLLFSWSGSLTVHRWFLDEGVVNQHIFKVIPKEGYPLWLVNQLVAHKLDEFKAIAADKATTMGHIQRRHLDEPVAVPTGDAIAREHGAMQALWGRALLAERERQRLAETRDALLPAFMSGRVTVRDAEAAVESAVEGDAVEPEAQASGTLW